MRHVQNLSVIQNIHTDNTGCLVIIQVLIDKNKLMLITGEFLGAVYIKSPDML